MKKAILLLTFAALSSAQTTVNGGRIFKGTLTSNGSVSVVDFSGAGSTAPVKVGTLASRSSACTQGQFYFATDAVAGQNLYFCTTGGAPGTWTQMSGGGGGSTTTTAGAGPPAGACTPPALYIDTTNQLLWFCSTTNTWKKPVPDTTVFPTLGGTNAWTGYNNASGGQWRPPESTVSNLPLPSTNLGKVFVVTDALTVGACGNGGGSTRELCRSNGANYECIGNCASGGGGGSGTPGGANGQMQVNSNGSFGGQAFVLSGATSQRGVECVTGTTVYSALTANATAQEVTIVPAIPGTFRFMHILVQESTQFVAAAVSGLSVSAGKIGVDTDLLPTFALKQATAPQNVWYERPGLPQVGAGTYDLVLQFVGSSNLGTGTTSNFTAGTVTWEVCGYGVQ